MPERFLIVNADDLGASPGINRGIIEAHVDGIVTSASLMVDEPGAEDAAVAITGLPDLSVGLHARFTSEAGALRIDPGACAAELERQLERFRELTGREPTHLDSHHNVHRDPRFTEHFRSLAARLGLPMREHSPAAYHSSFYGQWKGGTTALDQVSVEALKRTISHLSPGITELGCHPGYIDPEFSSSYRLEREAEVRTLRAPSVREHLMAEGVSLISFSQLTAGVATSS